MKCSFVGGGQWAHRLCWLTCAVMLICWKSCWFFWCFVFFSRSGGDSTWRGTCCKRVCGLCTLLGPLSDNVVDSLLRTKLISVESLLALCVVSRLPSRPLLPLSAVFHVLCVTNQRAVQWCGCLKRVVLLCSDDFSRTKATESTVCARCTASNNFQRSKCGEPITVTFTLFYSSDWSCYRNGYEFDWTQRVHGGNAMLNTYWMLSLKHSMWWSPCYLPNQLSSEIPWPWK